MLGGKLPPVVSRYASPTSPSGPSRKTAAGAAAYKQTPAQTRRHVNRQQGRKSQNPLGILSTGQGSEAFASQSGGPTSSQQGSVCYHPHRPAPVAHDRSIDYANLFAAVYPDVVQTQTQGPALKRRVSDPKSQVSRLTSELYDVRSKSRQGYDHLNLRWTCWRGW